ncbi:MAG: hypothetical protein HYX69_04425 [Planctomycetia bacterium]|nr:hypothetical protein [Planctomycetia bacterium]
MDTSLHDKMLLEVRAEIADLAARIEQLRAVERYHEARTTDLWGDRIIQVPTVTLAGRRQIDAAEVVLRRANRPLKTMEILEQMAAGGFEITGGMKQAKMSLFTSMTRKKHVFKKVGRGLWQIAQMNGDR